MNINTTRFPAPSSTYYIHKIGFNPKNVVTVVNPLEEKKDNLLQSFVTLKFPDLNNTFISHMYRKKKHYTLIN